MDLEKGVLDVTMDTKLIKVMLQVPFELERPLGGRTTAVGYWL